MPPLSRREYERNATLLAQLSLSPEAYRAYRARHDAPLPTTDVLDVPADATAIVGKPFLYASRVFGRDFIVYEGSPFARPAILSDGGEPAVFVPAGGYDAGELELELVRLHQRWARLPQWSFNSPRLPLSRALEVFVVLLGVAADAHHLGFAHFPPAGVPLPLEQAAMFCAYRQRLQEALVAPRVAPRDLGVFLARLITDGLGHVLSCGYDKATASFCHSRLGSWVVDAFEAQQAQMEPPHRAAAAEFLQQALAAGAGAVV